MNTLLIKVFVCVTWLATTITTVSARPLVTSKKSNLDNHQTESRTLAKSGVEWSSLVLASPSRPGIPGGDFVGPFVQVAQNVIFPGIKYKTPDGGEDVLGEGYLEQFPNNAEELKREEEEVELKRPRNLTFKVGLSGVYLTWSPPVVTHINNEPIIEYLISRYDENNIFTTTDLGKTRSLSFLDRTALKGKSYIYVVSAMTKNSGGPARATPPVRIP